MSGLKCILSEKYMVAASCAPPKPAATVGLYILTLSRGSRCGCGPLIVGTKAQASSVCDEAWVMADGFCLLRFAVFDCYDVPIVVTP